MRARTLYNNITHTHVSAGAAKALAALAVFLCLACSNTSVIDDIPEIDINGKDPMTFTCLAQDNEQEHTTRAVQALATDFVVSTYKKYATTGQQTVMDRYHVEYKTSGTAWDGTSRAYWDYTQVSGQYEKYWDYSAFPYRFHAVAPYPANASEVTLDDRNLKINKLYKMQTCNDGTIAPSNIDAEPYLIAQIQRNTDGTDQDLIKLTGSVNNTSTTKNRYVAMPFHHINSKVRFGIYTTTQWLTANKTYIKDLTVKVVSSSFVKEATQYEATGTGSWLITDGSGFKSQTTENYSTTTPLTILTYAGGANKPGNDLTHCQTRQTAFFFDCAEGIMQIPQMNVQMVVSFKLMKADDDTEYATFVDKPIKIEYADAPDNPTIKFDWTTGNIHTYYLVIGEVDNKLEITFTATLTPWEDVTGSLTTDLEQ